MGRTKRAAGVSKAPLDLTALHARAKELKIRSSKRVALSVRVDESLYLALIEAGEKKGVDLAEILRMSIAMGLKHVDEYVTPETFKPVTIAPWASATPSRPFNAVEQLEGMDMQDPLVRAALSGGMHRQAGMQRPIPLIDDEDTTPEDIAGDLQ